MTRKWYAILRLAAGLLVLAGCAHVPVDPNPLAKSSPGAVRVLSWNVAKDSIFPDGPGDYNRHERFARVLRALQPDVACLQEVFAGGARAAALFDELLPLGAGRRWQQHAVLDNVILARGALSRRDGETLDVGEGRQRGHALALVDIGKERQLQMVCAHFQSGAGARAETRERQADLVGAKLRQMKSAQGVPARTPIVVLGDLNAIANMPALFVANLRNGSIGGVAPAAGQGPDWDGSELEDADPRHIGLPGLNWTWRVDETGFEPGALDRILYTGSVLQLERSFVLDTSAMSEAELQRTGLQRGDEMYRVEKNQHDHLPLVADFRL